MPKTFYSIKAEIKKRKIETDTVKRTEKIKIEIVLRSTCNTTELANEEIENEIMYLINCT